MAGTVGCNIAAAVLDVFSFTLLIPFLDRLFNQPAHETKLSALQNQLLGAFLNGERPEAALLRIVWSAAGPIGRRVRYGRSIARNTSSATIFGPGTVLVLWVIADAVRRRCAA